jgi:outer membrane protein OmpA-like peptidoglycan-associated protein
MSNGCVYDGQEAKHGTSETHRDSRKNRVSRNSDHLTLGEPVHFATGSSSIERDSQSILEDLAAYLEENQDITLLRIEGHTDNVGIPSQNLQLSGKRAKAVRNWLVEHDIDESRLVAVGCGGTKPTASNSTEEGRAENRRTEYVVVGGNEGRRRARASEGCEVFE